jgi:hypothetical protein
VAEASVRRAVKVLRNGLALLLVAFGWLLVALAALVEDDYR